jgi:hypothetical protein
LLIISKSLFEELFSLSFYASEIFSIKLFEDNYYLPLLRFDLLAGFLINLLSLC